MKNLRLAAVAILCIAPAIVWSAPESYKIDPVHSFIVFKVRHMNVGNAYGTFNDFQGFFLHDEENAENNKLEIAVDANSLDTKNAKRDEHSKSPDFLNVKQFPTITFKSESVKKISDTEAEMTGPLTLHGVTKPVTAKVVKIGEATDPKGVHRVGGEATFVIKRSDYGMTNMLNNLGDEITLTVAVEGIRADAAAPVPTATPAPQ